VRKQYVATLEVVIEAQDIHTAKARVEPLVQRFNTNKGNHSHVRHIKIVSAINRDEKLQARV
jgi:hypothetical protein